MWRFEMDEPEAVLVAIVFVLLIIAIAGSAIS